MPDAPRRFGLIGCGRIGLPIIECWRAGGLPGWALSGVLARSPRPFGALQSTDDADAFFGIGHDLIVEVAGPLALAMHGERALGCADVWTVDATALAEPALLDALQAAGTRSGRRLRVMSGAIAGLDGVAMASVDPHAVLRVDVDLLPGPGTRHKVFSGTAREAARRYPDHVNVATTAALAGPGLDATRVDVYHPGPVTRHRLALRADSRYGIVEASLEPIRTAGAHPVAACVIAALRAELQTVWVG